MKNCLLSIIVPVYNTEPFLRDCLDSFFVQDIAEQAYEVICVDDGSTDRSAQILDEYASAHANLSVFHQQNAGVSSARNKGLDHARGKYIWFVDSDDLIAGNCLGAIKNTLTETDCDQLIVLPAEFAEAQPVTCSTVFSTENCSLRIGNYLITRILKKSIIDGNHLRFDPLISYQEDNVFYTMLYPYITIKAEITSRIIYYYRVRKNSLSRGGLPSERIISSYIAAATDMKKLHETNGDNYNGYAYNLYRFMTAAMCAVARCPADLCKRYLTEVKEKKLFPLKYAKQYTVRNENTSKGWKIKIKRRISSLSYTRTGFLLLRLLHKVKLL